MSTLGSSSNGHYDFSGTDEEKYFTSSDNGRPNSSAGAKAFPPLRPGETYNPWRRHDIRKEWREDTSLSSSQVRVLETLTEYTREDQAYVWPCFERIGKEMGRSRSQAIRVVGSLMTTERPLLRYRRVRRAKAAGQRRVATRATI